MSKSKELEKYEISKEDWKNMSVVDLKLKCETVVSLFLALKNTLSPHITPVESEVISYAEDHLLKYMDGLIESVDVTPTQVEK